MQISKKIKGKELEQLIITSIPSEILIDILKRVPCKDLCEILKLVCKKWYSIIFNGTFAYLHFERRNTCSSFSQLEAVHISTHDQHSVTLSSVEWDNYVNQPSEEVKTKGLYTIENVLGACHDMMCFYKVNSVNGFVCFQSHDARFHICNPMTKEYVTTPANPNGLCTAGGLGFCPISYQYKLVVFEHHDGLHVPESDRIKGSILTVGTDNSWRSLKWNHHSLYPLDGSVAYMNGVLFWCTVMTLSVGTPRDKNNTHTTTLVSFDVAKEEFDIIVVPIKSHENNVYIEDKGGRLRLMTKTELPLYFILFKGYVAHNNDDLGSIDSWRVEFTVTAPNVYGTDCVLGMSFTNEILMVKADTTWGFFDVATGRLLGEFHGGSFTTLIPYVPSLVPLSHRPIREKFYLDAVCGLFVSRNLKGACKLSWSVEQQ